MSEKVKYKYYRIYLSAAKDADLVALALDTSFNIRKYFKKVIISYICGDRSFKIKTPVPQISQSGVVPVELKDIWVNILFNTETEKYVIEYLSYLKKGQVGCFFKNIFRSYLEEPYVYPYFSTYNYVKIKKNENEDNLSQKADRVSMNYTALSQQNNHVDYVVPAVAAQLEHSHDNMLDNKTELIILDSEKTADETNKEIKKTNNKDVNIKNQPATSISVSPSVEESTPHMSPDDFLTNIGVQYD